MKGKYKPKPKKKVKPTPPPPIVLVEQFTTSMLADATCGSFKFESISEEELKKIVANRKIESNIHKNKLSEELSRILGRNITEAQMCVSLYDMDDLIIVQRSIWSPWDVKHLNYFYCQVFSNNNRDWDRLRAHPSTNSIR